MNIPQELRAGDSVTWYDDETSDNLGNSLTPGTWTLNYAIRGPDTLDIVATVEDGKWKSTISAAASDIATGTYYWQAFVTSGSEKITLGSGQIVILANLINQGPSFDGRSQAEQDLAAVQAAMRAMISGGAVQSYTIGNRMLTKMSMTDLITLESRLKAQVVREQKAEKIKNGLGNPHNLYVRF